LKQPRKKGGEPEVNRGVGEFSLMQPEPNTAKVNRCVAVLSTTARSVL
jgi:hypothetical protein